MYTRYIIIGACYTYGRKYMPRYWNILYINTTAVPTDVLGIKLEHARRIFSRNKGQYE